MPDDDLRDDDELEEDDELGDGKIDLDAAELDDDPTAFGEDPLAAE